MKLPHQACARETTPNCRNKDFVPGWIVRHIDWSDPAHPTIRPEPLPPDPDPPANAGPVAALPPGLRLPAAKGN